MMAFMGHKEEESTSEDPVKAESSDHLSSSEEHGRSTVKSPITITETTPLCQEGTQDSLHKDDEISFNNADTMTDEHEKHVGNKTVDEPLQSEGVISFSGIKEEEDSPSKIEHKAGADEACDNSQPEDSFPQVTASVDSSVDSVLHAPERTHHASDSQGSHLNEPQAEQLLDKGFAENFTDVVSVQESFEKEPPAEIPLTVANNDHADELSQSDIQHTIHTEQDHVKASDSVLHDTGASPSSVDVSVKTMDLEPENVKPLFTSSNNTLSTVDPFLELEKVKQEMKMMEAALQGAARQAQVIHFQVIWSMTSTINYKGHCSLL